MDIITLDDLKEQIKELLPNALFEIDEETNEVIIMTSMAADDNGDLEPLDFDGEEDETEDDDDEND